MDAEGKEMRFVESDEGVYYYDTNRYIGIALISTIKHNKSNYTGADYQHALAACKL